MVPDEIWFIAIIWLFMFVLTYITKKAFIGGLSTVFTFFFGFSLIQTLTEYRWIGLFMFFFGLFLLYETLFKLMPGKKEKGKKG